MVYIAGDTLRHQPMGAGHMMVLQLCGPMAFIVLQWCHPMLASTTRTSCCTRMITLYGARKWIQAHAFHVSFYYPILPHYVEFFANKFSHFRTVVLFFSELHYQEKLAGNYVRPVIRLLHKAT